MKVIILAGGSGTRLWPLSRTHFPKQFLKLKNMDKSIFQLTIERSLKLTTLSQIYFVTSIDYKFFISGQLEEMGLVPIEENILLEPEPKNTLPAIYFAVHEICKHGDDMVVVLPSDHLVKDVNKFVESIQSGLIPAENHLITYGIVPTYPEVGFGYIKPGQKIDGGFLVEKFKEKPVYPNAVEYMKSGYLWNSGMFLFDTRLFKSELALYNPQIIKSFQHRSIEAVYKEVPAISIDYGLMERSSLVAVVPFDASWNDFGSFDAFYDEYKDHKDRDGNVFFNNEIMINARNNLVYSDTDKAVAVAGVNDLIVVDQKDALLICHKNDSQKVSDIVMRLKERGDSRIDDYITEYRPWGSFTILEKGDFYKIKRISVMPGKLLSYQMHYHRNEHWVVIHGTASVIVDENETLVRSGDSVFIKAGSKHRLINSGKILLEVIEVQIGSYLEEDDIERFDDAYGR